MNFLDVRTVIFSHILTDAICALVLTLLWSQDRKRYSGLNLFLGDFILQTLAVLLISLRGRIPDWLSMGPSDILVVVGALLGYIGLVRFLDLKISQVHNYFLLAIFTLVHLFFAFIMPNLAIRNLVLAVGLLVICAQCVWLILQKINHSFRQISLSVALVFLFFCLVSIIRIGVILINPSSSNDFFKSGMYDTLILMAYQVLLILLAFSLALMVNRRLLLEVQTEEEKYTKAFQSSPYAITLTRGSDGKILEVNDSFTTITGYTPYEVLGKTTIDLNLWANEEDRDSVLHDLSRGIPIKNREYSFRKKSGKVLTGLFSAEMIMIEDQPWVLSSISDITGRKEAEVEKEILARFPAENPNPVLRISRSGVLLYANPASQFLLLAWKNKVGNTVPQNWKEMVNQSFGFQKHLTTEFQMSDRSYSCTIFPIYSMDYVNVYVTDITERKKYEDELRKRNEELKQFNNAAVGRELRMIELKKEINVLNTKLGKPASYPVGSKKSGGSGKK